MCNGPVDCGILLSVNKDSSAVSGIDKYANGDFAVSKLVYAQIKHSNEVGSMACGGETSFFT